VCDEPPGGYRDLGVPDARPPALAGGVRDPAASDRIRGPFASVAYVGDRLHLATDVLGYVKVYRARTPRATVWSSKASIASLFAFGDTRASSEGWTSAISHQRFLDATSPVNGVTLEAPWATVGATDAADGLGIRHGDATGQVFDGLVPVHDFAGRMEEVLGHFHRALGDLQPSHIRIPLSGGRDSRVIVATALVHGRVDEFYTGTPPPLDLELAGELVARLDRRIPWTTLDRAEETRRKNEEGEADLDARGLWDGLTRYQRHADGDGEVTLYRTGIPNHVAGKVALWGVGGEFARARMYNAAALEDPATYTSRFWARLRSGSPLVDVDVRAAVLPSLVARMRDPLDARGLAGLRQLDYFHVFQRLRRTNNRIVMAGHAIYPYFSSTFVRAAFTQSPEERVVTHWWDELVARTVPAWLGVPYAHPDEGGAEDATKQELGRAFWESPYPRRIGREMLDLLASDHLIARPEALRIADPKPGGGVDPFAAMNEFNRLLNYASYLAYLDRLRADFAAAGGVSGIVGATAPPPDVRPATARTIAMRRLGHHTRRGMRLIRRVAPRPAPRSR
jgi:asparagine synthase (glutamine-hydrolysing)